jgi:hypothetical protein
VFCSELTDVNSVVLPTDAFERIVDDEFGESGRG